VASILSKFFLSTDMFYCLQTRHQLKKDDAHQALQGLMSVVSSADNERLFSQAAGMPLTKQRKRMLPEVMKMSVYIRYEKKIYVSEEDLKKGIEEDRVDEYEVGVLDEDLAE